MRNADIETAWKQCRTLPLATLSLTRIELIGRGSQALFESRIGCLVGANGAGKTSILLSVASALGANVPDHRRLHVRVEGLFRGRPFALAGPEDLAPPDLTAAYLDPSAKCHDFITLLVRKPNFHETMEQAGWEDLSERDLEAFRYVCGHNFTAASVSEVELPAIHGTDGAFDSDEESEYFPVFRVERGGMSYDSRSMGFGELCATYVVWKLLKAERGSLLLLDEPDSHLSPASRRALVRFLGFAAHTNKLAIVFSSHFSEPLSSLEEKELTLVLPDGSSAHPRLEPIGVKRRAARALGLMPRTSILLVVEDVDALEVTRQIVNRWGDGCGPAVDVQIVGGGASSVAALVQAFPQTARACKVFAVLDGDQRPNYSGANFLFLPGNDDPVASARAVAVADPAALAAYIGTDSSNVEDALQRVAHVDHHDFCRAFLDELHIAGTVANVREALIRVWLGDAAVAVEARELGARVADLVDQIPLTA